VGDGGGWVRGEGVAMNKDRLENLLNKCGIAINANNGRCAIIEETLCEMTTLLVELLADTDEQEYSEAMHRENPAPHYFA
jgi:hypothetical protein